MEKSPGLQQGCCLVLGPEMSMLGLLQVSVPEPAEGLVF